MKAPPDQADLPGGSPGYGIATLVISFALLLSINGVQVWSRQRIGYV